MTDEAQEKPKIIIDEDWKSQVEQERERFKEGEGQPDPVATPGDAPGVQYGDMIKLRRYSNGVAVVNPTDVVQEIELPGAYYDPEEMDDGTCPWARS